MHEREQKIREAIELVKEAQMLVDEAVRGRDEMGAYRGYGRYGFDQLLGNGNRYNHSLYDLINLEAGD